MIYFKNRKIDKNYQTYKLLLNQIIKNVLSDTQVLYLSYKLLFIFKNLINYLNYLKYIL